MAHTRAVHAAGNFSRIPGRHGRQLRARVADLFARMATASAVSLLQRLR
ncbi:Hypothetical protein CAP_5969 [Chondromyces apiculatus DSM 436]|uniref:Uncharacterized protein n=1 Tax=Chondromyces apiculatus DSM 436 TaxID=1192034 RepID=A0A017TFZ2_9BACT|nr:Hypothetical protein CAP_5969 [Chondromyces apiculatus DSM 436]